MSRPDAEQLARLGRIDPALLNPIRHRGQQAQQDLALIRSRDSLVRTRTALINHVRGAVKAHGGRLPRCSAPAFPRKAADAIPEELRLALLPHLELIGHLSREITAADRAVEQLIAERYPDARALRQVPGVGPLTALTFVLTLEDPARFRRSRQVAAYLGLTPRQRQSGERSQQLGIAKAGDRHLRRLLVSCAHYILGPFGPDSDLRRWGLRYAPRGVPREAACGRRRGAQAGTPAAAAAEPSATELRAMPPRDYRVGMAVWTGHGQLLVLAWTRLSPIEL